MAARRYLKRYPKSDDECQAWIAAVSSSDGKVIEGVSKSVKHRLRKLFFVDKGQLKEKETGLPVFVLTDFPNLWQKYHIDMNCPGLKATKKLIAEAVAGVPESEIEKARRRCEGCKLKGIIPKAPVGKPIRSSAVWGRVQIDLIDMKSVPDGEYNWIFHAKDHLSKFAYGQPLKTKTAREVATAIRSLFHLYGPPLILQHDNGGEFTGNPVKEMMAKDFPYVKIIRGGPRHPQSQGMVENANGTLEKRIMAWKVSTGRSDWAAALQEIVYKRNQEYSRTTGTTAYELFFARKHAANSRYASSEDDDTASDNEVAVDDHQGTVPAARDGQLYLLYKYSTQQSKVVAIARKVEEEESFSDRHASFEIVKMLCDDEQGPDDEPMSDGCTVLWELQFATNKLGTTVDQIETRSKGFERYLKNRKQQGDEWLKKAINVELHKGDRVLLPIPKVDRSSVCPRVVEAEVVDVDRAYAMLATPAGIIKTKKRKDQLFRLDPDQRSTSFTIPAQSVSLIGATRARTSYGKKASKMTVSKESKKQNGSSKKSKKQDKPTAPTEEQDLNLCGSDSEDDMSDWESSPATLRRLHAERRAKRKERQDANFCFKTVADREKYYQPAVKAAMSQECFDYLYEITSRNIESDFDFCFRNNMGKTRRHRSSGENANPLLDGTYLEQLVNCLSQWFTSLFPDFYDDLEPDEQLLPSELDYIWAVWLPEAVRFGLIHGLHMTEEGASEALCKPLEVAKE